MDEIEKRGSLVQHDVTDATKSRGSSMSQSRVSILFRVSRLSRALPLPPQTQVCSNQCYLKLFRAH